MSLRVRLAAWVVLLVPLACNRPPGASQTPDPDVETESGSTGAKSESEAEAELDYPRLLAALDDAATRSAALDELERAALAVGAGRGTEASRDAMDAISIRFADELDAIAVDPKRIEDEVRAQRLIAFVMLLGRARHPGALEPMLRALDTVDLPVAVQRELATALGRIGDPRAVDSLLAAPFRIADSPSTSSIGERVVRALGAIGESALPGVLVAVAGTNQRINGLCAELGLDPMIARISAARAAGVIGSSRATGPLLALFAADQCPFDRDADGYAELMMRQPFAARALGQVGDPAAVADLCACAGTDEPSLGWEVVTALGRIGGPEAFACLATVVDTSRYHPDAASQGFEHELRWEGYRWAVLAAEPGDADELRAVRDRALPAVQAKIDAGGYGDAIAVLDDCGDAPDCYAERLADTSAPIPARELAAFRLARLAAPGDLEAAAALALAFEIQDPSVRVNMAWLTRKVAAGRACPVCSETLRATIERERGSVAATMQLAWITANETIEQLR